MPADLTRPLAKELERLWRSPQPTAAGLRQLARGILVEAWDNRSADSFLLGPKSEPRQCVLATSVTAARLLAWMSGSFALVKGTGEDLILAALLADAARVRPGRPALAAENRDHPAIAAGLAAGIVDAPVALSQWIRRHHERCDGTGFPAGLSRSRLSSEDRLLAAAIRFAELQNGDPSEAARRLHEEARLGLYDAELTANIVWSLGQPLPSEAGFGQSAPRPWALTDRGRQRLRIDDAHAGLNRPHFLVEGRARSSIGNSDRMSDSEVSRP